MDNPASLLRAARRHAGLSQAQLARSLGVSQAAVAKLEHPNSNPTVHTLDRALRATGRRLSLASSEWRPGVDEGLIRHQLERTPVERIRGIETMYSQAHRLARAGRISRGEQP
jgi:transcriptional regulator with XRE-family HTH domain